MESHVRKQAQSRANALFDVHIEMDARAYAVSDLQGKISSY